MRGACSPGLGPGGTSRSPLPPWLPLPLGPVGLVGMGVPVPPLVMSPAGPSVGVESAVRGLLGPVPGVGAVAAVMTGSGAGVRSSAGFAPPG
ncbi:hypothetical protein GA0115255_101552 [Streptomyces sp. Ncost-T6T-2b]|nr:hypothetical protein GA0115255_101552 [Streptomyces sp. Ncost-T6T-2b]